MKQIICIISAIFFYFIFSNNYFLTERNKHLKKGDLAPEIKLPNLVGDTVLLSDYRGSMVFVDFWASWCKGCIDVSKRLCEVQNRYTNSTFKNGEKGFYILSVCLDTEQNRWKNTIQRDSLNNFIHVSDLKGTKSSVAQNYGVSEGLPAGYLINGEGVVIANMAKLLEVLKKEEIRIEPSN